MIVVVSGDSGYVADSVRAMGVEYYGMPMKGLKDIFLLRRLVKKYNIQNIHTTLDRTAYLGF